MGVYVITIPQWLPPRLNEVLARHWGVRKKAQADADGFVATYAKMAGVPKAEGKRRVSLLFRRARSDPDARWKFILDACVHAGLLTGDSAGCVEMGEAACEWAEERATIITLEDVT